MSAEQVDPELEFLRYPIGRFKKPTVMSRAVLEDAVAVLAELPENLRHVLEDLDDEQLDTPYRPGGWTVRMVTHHLADSHMHANARVRFALTEEKPTIMPYPEDAWANLYDSPVAPTAWSVQLLESLHARWVMLLQGLDDAQWKRVYVHPEHDKELSVELTALIYAWHSRHHVAHIMRLRERMNW